MGGGKIFEKKSPLARLFPAPRLALGSRATARVALREAPKGGQGRPKA
jgi:hypothetical protein